MKTLIEIEINEEYHLTKLADYKKVSIYIPEKELCLPKEENYYGLKEFEQVSNFIDEDTDTFYTTARNFIRDAKTSSFGFEIACSPENLLSNGTYLGYSILHFVKENCLSLKHLDFYHLCRRPIKHQYRFNNILKRLYNGLRTTEMTDNEWEIYNSPSKILSQKNIELDIEVQELRNEFLKSEHSYYIDDKAIDEFLISIHRNYFGES